MIEWQLPLFPPPPPTLRQRLLGRLLWRANQQPIPASPDRFYALKSRLLTRHGSHTGTVWQQINHPCWGCTGAIPEYEQDDCPRCEGTGLYAVRYHRLEQWTLGSRTFLVPVDSTPVKPRQIDIVGRVKHPAAGPLAVEAGLWLALLFDRPLFRMCLDRGPYLALGIQRAGLCPLLWLCRIVRHLRWRPRRYLHRCVICQRWLSPWSGSRWYCSQRCEEAALRDTDPPF